MEEKLVEIGQKYESLSPNWRRVWQVESIFANKNDMLHARLRDVSNQGVRCTVAHTALLDEARFRPWIEEELGPQSAEAQQDSGLQAEEA